MDPGGCPREFVNSKRKSFILGLPKDFGNSKEIFNFGPSQVDRCSAYIKSHRLAPDNAESAPGRLWRPWLLQGFLRVSGILQSRENTWGLFTLA